MNGRIAQPEPPVKTSYVPIPFGTPIALGSSACGSRAGVSWSQGAAGTSEACRRLGDAQHRRPARLGCTVGQDQSGVLIEVQDAVAGPVTPADVVVKLPQDR